MGTYDHAVAKPVEKFIWGLAKHLACGNAMWQHPDMITFQTLSDDHPDLAHSPLLRAALLTLQYTREHGAVGLTKTMAFRRVFVHWAVEHFNWPGSSSEEMFRYNKVINEYEFPPLELLHFLLIKLRLARHFKGEFRLTQAWRRPCRGSGAAVFRTRSILRPRDRPRRLFPL